MVTGRKEREWTKGERVGERNGPPRFLELAYAYMSSAASSWQSQVLSTLRIMSTHASSLSAALVYGADSSTINPVPAGLARVAYYNCLCPVNTGIDDLCRMCYPGIHPGTHTHSAWLSLRGWAL